MRISGVSALLLACVAFAVTEFSPLAAETDALVSSSGDDLSAAGTQEDDMASEIVVIAERAKLVRIKFNIDDRTRRVKCKAVRSSGDKEFDRAMCQPVYRCAKVEPFNESTVRACMERARADVFREWAQSRRAQ